MKGRYIVGLLYHNLTKALKKLYTTRIYGINRFLLPCKSLRPRVTARVTHMINRILVLAELIEGMGM